MGGLLNLVNEWLVRVLVLLSFAAYLVLILFAGVRRRRASGWQMLLLWPAYQVADLAATQALANLFLGSTSQELQLVAFWTPFLLMHLGRPDNISAYSLEDNVLAGRQVLGATTRVVSAIYVLYKHIVVGGNAGTMLPASFIMFFLGIAKYMEGALALWRGNLGNIRSSLKTLTPKGLSSDLQSGGEELDNEQALLAAHDLFYVCKGAFADFSFGKNPLSRDRSRRKEFSRGWKGVSKVVEMELSLMYDIMYTKAASVHTWVGYGIRIISPPFTVVVFLLFWLHSKEGQRSGDVIITYIFLFATFILDVRWLLGALGSTWTYAFIDERGWLHSSMASIGRWHGLRRFVVSLDPCRLFVEDPTSYRMWSGTIGRYNLLRECTHETTTSVLSRFVKIFATRGIWMEYQYGYLDGIEIVPVVRDLLFEKLWEKLKSAFPEQEVVSEPEPPKKEEPAPPPPEPDIVPDPRAGFVHRRKVDEALEIGSEFQEVVLTWHIATEVFLLCRPRNAAASFKHVKAIKEVSSYMMFVVAVRPHMLPGLKLSSLHEATRDALKEIWHDNKGGSPACCTTTKQGESELASILLNKEKMRPGSEPDSRSKLYDWSVILSDGTQYARLMLRRLSTPNHANKREKSSKDMPTHHLLPDLWYGEVLELQEMLEGILDAWVRLLIYASIRCSRDSHAKQLGRGGELTTIVWILADHAAVDRQTRRHR
uniref:Uncharacterized protein n=1 Tax=Avena sativa TaxID=4498 RepID=A0ACD6A983_AVESA